MIYSEVIRHYQKHLHTSTLITSIDSNRSHVDERLLHQPDVGQLFLLPLRRLCRNGEKAWNVILNEVKNLIDSATYKTEILRLKPQNDIATQSSLGGIEAAFP